MIGIPVDVPPMVKNSVLVEKHQVIKVKQIEAKELKVLKVKNPKKIILHFANSKAQTYEVIPPLDKNLCYRVTGYASPVGKKYINQMLSALRAVNIATSIRTTGIKAFAYAGGESKKYGRAVVIEGEPCE